MGLPKGPARGLPVRHVRNEGLGKPNNRDMIRNDRLSQPPIEIDGDWVNEDLADAPPQLRVTPFMPRTHPMGYPTKPGEHPPSAITAEDVQALIEEMGTSTLFYDAPLAECRRIYREQSGIAPVTTRKRIREHPFLAPRLGCVFLKRREMIDPRLICLTVDLAMLDPQTLICDPSTMAKNPDPWPDEVTKLIEGPFHRFARDKFRWGQDPPLYELVDDLGFERGALALAGLRAGSIAVLGTVPVEAVRWNTHSNFRAPVSARRSA